MKRGLGRACVGAVVLLWAGWAGAQERVDRPERKPANSKDLITVEEVKVTGRIQKPIAAVDVARIRPQVRLKALRRSFLDRIERAVYRRPF